MSRARQVANFDPALFTADEVSGNKVHGGTISGSPVLVTPNIGTPNAGVVTNLSGVLPVEVTGGSGLTALGTVTAGSIGSAVTGFTGIKETDSWALNTSFTGEASTISNWTRVADSINFTKLGTGLTESGGVFTFPATGYWYIDFNSIHYFDGVTRYIGANIDTSVSTGSSYQTSATSYTHIHDSLSGSTYTQNACSFVFHVENISTDRAKFSISGNPATFSTGDIWTNATFIRIGDA